MTGLGRAQQQGLANRERGRRRAETRPCTRPPQGRRCRLQRLQILPHAHARLDKINRGKSIRAGRTPRLTRQRPVGQRPDVRSATREGKGASGGQGRSPCTRLFWGGPQPRFVTPDLIRGPACFQPTVAGQVPPSVFRLPQDAVAEIRANWRGDYSGRGIHPSPGVVAMIDSRQTPDRPCETRSAGLGGHKIRMMQDHAACTTWSAAPTRPTPRPKVGCRPASQDHPPG